MARAGLGALLLYDPVNIRYATGTRDCGVFSHRFYQRYVLIGREGRPILFGGVTDQVVCGDDVEVREALVWDYFPCGRNLEPAAQRWARDLMQALEKLGARGEPLGVDRLDVIGYQALAKVHVDFVDGRVPVEKARALKTEDELALIRQACAIGDVAACDVKRALRTGVSENELFAILAGTNLRFGGEHMDLRFLTAGGNTNPWYRFASDRIVRTGDLVAFDTDMAGPLGYFTDFSRTYLCGEVKPTPPQREAYSVAYNFIQDVLPMFRVGASFVEIAEAAPRFPEAYRARRYVVLAHGVGMSDEWPSIYFPDVSLSGFGNDPDVLRPGMVLSVEALAARANMRESVKLEEQIIITDAGPEVITTAPHESRLLE
jgi:Xaa-Pro aminopeptidase